MDGWTDVTKLLVALRKSLEGINFHEIKFFLKISGFEVSDVSLPSALLEGGSHLNPKIVPSPSKVILLQQTQAFMNIH